MAYPYTPKLIFPLKKYQITGLQFGARGIFQGVDWGIHLGEDISVRAGATVRAVGRGRVIYSALHPGSREHSNWGNIIIIAHKNPVTKKIFYSLYGHLGRRLKERGEKVECGEKIGFIGKSYTASNGWWKAHLHFAIYIGQWSGVVLPGYYHSGQKRTQLRFWKKPSQFIVNYK
jgi:murein DD-endopeptidase MepM/ murein hydrolase activator NlpD